jgi:Mlc titration factor MtfA (ptsG expression regulator)
MILSWLKRRRRRRLAREPFRGEWLEILTRNVRHYARLTEPERAKLRGDVAILVAEKNWEGCGGLQMNDEIKVTVAALASLLLLGFDDEYFNAVLSILVYPDAFVAPDQIVTEGGLVLEGESSRDGEAWYRGPVILSWADALAAARGQADGHNVVVHEFAHQLDMQNGRAADGIPRLRSREGYERWERVLQAEYDQLVEDCRQHRPTPLDCYGTTDLSELFAVATECFIEQPRRLLHSRPQLYALLQDYFRQHPATRM